MNSSLDQRKAGILVAALFSIGVIIFFVQQTTEKKEQESKSALYQIETVFEEEQKALPEAERVAGANLDVDAKFPKTISKLNEMITAKRVNKQVLFEAGVKLGTLYLEHQHADKALPVFKNVTAEAGTSFQKASSYFLLGVASERSNQLKDASLSYEKGLSTHVDGLKGELLLGMVRVSLKLNDKEKAKLYLEKMNKEVSGSRAVQIASELVNGIQT